MRLHRYFAEPTVSTEGIFDAIGKLFKKKTEAAKEGGKSDQPLQSLLELEKWFMTDFQSNFTSYEPASETVEIPAKFASFFVEANGAPIKNIAARLSNEIRAYMSVSNSALPHFNKTQHHLQDVSKKFDGFVGNADRLEEFVKVFEDAVKTQPKSTSEVFREPTYSFLGFGKDGFLVSQVEFEYEAYPVDGKASVKIPALSKDEVRNFVKVIGDLGNFTLGVFMIHNEATLGFDFTDPPTRGYSGDTRVQDLTNKAKFFHPVYEEGNTNLFHCIESRCNALMYAMLTYLRKCVG